MIHGLPRERERERARFSLFLSHSLLSSPACCSSRRSQGLTFSLMQQPRRAWRTMRNRSFYALGAVFLSAREYRLMPIHASRIVRLFCVHMTRGELLELGTRFLEVRGSFRARALGIRRFGAGMIGRRVGGSVL